MTKINTPNDSKAKKTIHDLTEGMKNNTKEIVDKVETWRKEYHRHETKKEKELERERKERREAIVKFNKSFGGSTLIGAALGIDPAVISSIPEFWEKSGLSALREYGKTFKKDSNRTSVINGVSGKGVDPNDTEVGSAFANSKNSKIDKRLDKIIGLLGGKPGDTTENVVPEKEGFLSKLLGPIAALGSAIIPLLAGGLMAAAKPWTDKLLKGFFSDTLGLGSIGGILGGIISDMLPGAVTGYMLTRNAKGALIGGMISLGYYSLKKIINDFVNTGDLKAEDYASVLPYAEMGIRGGLLGATIGKSVKGGLIGAAIGIGYQWIRNKIQTAQQLLDGKPVEIKTIAGLPEDVSIGLVTGGILGGTLGGFKGAFLGAILGAASGLITTAATDFENRMLAAQNGEYTEALSLGPFSVDQTKDMLIGGTLGFATGGLPGLIAGALLGLGVGTIFDLYRSSELAKEAVQNDTSITNNSNWKDVQDRNNAQQSPGLQAYATQLLADTQMDVLAGFKKWDKNHNGILEENERPGILQAEAQSMVGDTQTQALYNLLKTNKVQGGISQNDLLKLSTSENLSSTAAQNSFSFSVGSIVGLLKSLLHTMEKGNENTEAVANSLTNPSFQLGGLNFNFATPGRSTNSAHSNISAPLGGK